MNKNRRIYASLISMDESNAMKGILIILVVLGHGYLLCQDYDSGDFLPFRQYIYLFHTANFFVLPFIYGDKGGNLFYEVRKNFVKLWIPYTWFFLLCLFIYIIRNRGYDICGIVKTYIVGSPPLTSTYLGVHFIWFLPSMFSLLILKLIWFQSTLFLKTIIVSLSILLWGMSLFHIEININFDYWNDVPFSLTYGLYYMLLGIVLRYIIKKVKYIVHIRLFTWTFFFISILIFTFHRDFVWLKLFVPLTTFLLLFVEREKYSNNRLFLVLGKNSLFIYLIHVFIYNIINPLLLLMFEKSYFVGVISFLLTLYISYLLSNLITKIKIIQLLIFPQIK